MQAVALEVADHGAVDVDLMQVTAAVIQTVHRTAIGQLCLDQVAQFVVAMQQLAGVGDFGQALSKAVVFESDTGRLPLSVGEGDR